MPPESISKLPVHDHHAVIIRASPRGGPRSITPPRSISQTPAHTVPHNETPLSLSSAVKLDPPGMQRGVTPAGSVITTNRYGGEAPWGGKVEAGTGYQGRQGRSILPPAPFSNEFGGSGYDLDALMMQHAKASSENVKDPEPSRSHHFDGEAIKAYSPAAPSAGSLTGGIRQISPPKSISSHSVSLSPPAGVSSGSMVAKRQPIGMPRSVTPPKGADAGANHYGESVESPKSVAKGSYVGQGRSILPPEAIKLAGSGAIDSDAFMEQHVKTIASLGLKGGAPTGMRPTTFSIDKVEQIAKQE